MDFREPQLKLRRVLMRCFLLVGAMTFCATSEASIQFNGSSGSLSASAVFDVLGSNLTVILSNTSSADVMAPADLLTGVYFDISGQTSQLGRVSALLNGGSTVVYGLSNGGNVGGEHAYAFNASGLSATLGNAKNGISNSGLGLFGPGNRFDTNSNLQGPTSPDGPQYGITSALDDVLSGNNEVNGVNGTALIKNSVKFTLSNLPTGFSLSKISNVWFQYGTDLTEPHFQSMVPEAASLVVWSLLAGMVTMRRRRAIAE